MTSNIITDVDQERIADCVRREGWDEFVIYDVLNTIEDEYAIDPEGGAPFFWRSTLRRPENGPIKPEETTTMTTVSKYTTSTAAATEVDARARRYVSEHDGVTFREAINVVLKADKQLAQAFAQPATR